MRVVIGPYKDKGNRKIDVRIDGFDTWSMDHTLSYLIVPMLKQLKKSKHGSPSQCFDYSHHSLDWDSKEFKEAEKKSDKAGHKLWGEILDKMIWSMTEIMNGHKHSPKAKFKWEDDPTDTRKCKRVNIKFIPNKKYKTYEQYREDMNVYENRIQEGCELFGKFFQALWD